MTTPVTFSKQFNSPNIEHFVERFGAGLTEGGVFVPTDEVCAVGTKLDFTLSLQDGSELLSGLGTVVWVRERNPNRDQMTVGMGIRFEQLSATSRTTLAMLLHTKQQESAISAGAATVAVLEPKCALDDLTAQDVDTANGDVAQPNDDPGPNVQVNDNPSLNAQIEDTEPRGATPDSLDFTEVPLRTRSRNRGKVVHLVLPIIAIAVVLASVAYFLFYR